MSKIIILIFKVSHFLEKNHEKEKNTRTKCEFQLYIDCANFTNIDQKIKRNSKTYKSPPPPPYTLNTHPDTNTLVKVV